MADTILVPPVRVAIERKQLRWLGHLARMKPDRVPVVMLAAVRRGNASSSLSPVPYPNVLCGSNGAYRKVLKKYLTPRNRLKFFAPSVGGSDGDNEKKADENVRLPHWHVLAREKGKWRAFCNEAAGDDGD